MFCNEHNIFGCVQWESCSKNVTRQKLQQYACSIEHRQPGEWTWIQSRYNSKSFYTIRYSRRRNSAAKLNPSSMRFAYSNALPLALILKRDTRKRGPSAKYISKYRTSVNTHAVSILHFTFIIKVMKALSCFGSVEELIDLLIVNFQ